MNFCTPKEILELTIKNSEAKARNSPKKQILLGFMGGLYIAIAGFGFVLCKAIFKGELEALGNIIGAVLFPAGLMMVVISGGELFTGNALMAAYGFENKSAWKEILLNWLYVYLGNFLGSVFVAILALASGKFFSANFFLGDIALSIAINKVEYSFVSAFSLGILCNILVAGAVWMATAAKDISGKIFACFFPIMLFVFSGFEHSVANMYYLFSAFLISKTPFFSGSVDPYLLSLKNIFLKNLIPVSLGNVVGGAVIIAGLYSITYKKKSCD